MFVRHCAWNCTKTLYEVQNIKRISLLNWNWTQDPSAIAQMKSVVPVINNNAVNKNSEQESLWNWPEQHTFAISLSLLLWHCTSNGRGRSALVLLAVCTRRLLSGKMPQQTVIVKCDPISIWQMIARLIVFLLNVN